MDKLAIGNVSVEIYKGDICTLSVDAVVNAANNKFLMGGGVAGAIKRQGGQLIEDEAVKQGTKRVGDVVVTSAGNLPAKYVIHAAVMAMDLKTSHKIISAATKNALEKAEEMKLESLAFPAFGTGVGGYPFDASAKAMLEEVKKFASGSKNVKRIIFALFGDEAVNRFKEALSKIS